MQLDFTPNDFDLNNHFSEEEIALILEALLEEKPKRNQNPESSNQFIKDYSAAYQSIHTSYGSFDWLLN